jgi:hypothetical protein
VRRKRGCGGVGVNSMWSLGQAQSDVVARRPLSLPPRPVQFRINSVPRLTCSASKSLYRLCSVHSSNPCLTRTS